MTTKDTRDEMSIVTYLVLGTHQKGSLTDAVRDELEDEWDEPSKVRIQFIATRYEEFIWDAVDTMIDTLKYSLVEALPHYPNLPQAEG